MVIPTKPYHLYFRPLIPNSAQGSQNWPFLMSNSCSAIGNSRMDCGTSLPAPHTHTLHDRLHYILVLHSFKIHSDSLHFKNWIDEIKLMMTAKIIMHWRARLPNLPPWRWVLCTWVYPTSQIDYRRPTLLWRLLGFRSWRSCVFQLRLIYRMAFSVLHNMYFELLCSRLHQWIHYWNWLCCNMLVCSKHCVD